MEVVGDDEVRERAVARWNSNRVVCVARRPRDAEAADQRLAVGEPLGPDRAQRRDRRATPSVWCWSSRQRRPGSAPSVTSTVVRLTGSCPSNANRRQRHAPPSGDAQVAALAGDVRQRGEVVADRVGAVEVEARRRFGQPQRRAVDRRRVIAGGAVVASPASGARPAPRLARGRRMSRSGALRGARRPAARRRPRARDVACASATSSGTAKHRELARQRSESTCTAKRLNVASAGSHSTKIGFAGAWKSCNSLHMSLTRRLAFCVLACAFLAAALALRGDARATVMQPSGETMPRADAPRTSTRICDVAGLPGGRRHARRSVQVPRVNGVAGRATCRWIRSATRTSRPGTFSPQCGLTGTIVLHGGGCKNELGWYNATEPADQAGRRPDLHAGPGEPAGRAAQRPHAARTTTSVRWPRRRPRRRPSTPGWIRCRLRRRTSAPDANYKGGLIGFALMGARRAASARRPSTRRPSSTTRTPRGKPWITTLIYQSVADPQAYYIAFEDQPTCAHELAGLHRRQPDQPGNGNDGDFNDFVFYVSGLSLQAAAASRARCRTRWGSARAASPSARRAA